MVLITADMSWRGASYQNKSVMALIERLTV